jgi:hypothetical protein
MKFFHREFKEFKEISEMLYNTTTANVNPKVGNPHPIITSSEENGGYNIGRRVARNKCYFTVIIQFNAEFETTKNIKEQLIILHNGNFYAIQLDESMDIRKLTSMLAFDRYGNVRSSSSFVNHCIYR